MAFWVELHCDNRGNAANEEELPTCQALNGAQPGILIGNTASLMAAKNSLQAEAKRRGYKKTEGGWICQHCQKSRRGGPQPGARHVDKPS